MIGGGVGGSGSAQGLAVDRDCPLAWRGASGGSAGDPDPDRCG
jgi:hypothetical protein